MYRVVAKSDKATDFPALIYSFNFDTLAAAEEAVKFFTDEDTILCQIVIDNNVERLERARIKEDPNGSEDQPKAD